MLVELKRPDFVGGQAGRPDPTRDQLAADTRALKAFFTRAEANLGQFAGKTIRVGGIAMKVTEVRNGKLIVSQGGAEMAVGPEKLEPEELLKLGLAGEPDSKSAAHQEFLFQFFFGRTEKAKTALAKAKAQGADLAFYEERIAELEQGQEKARAEKEAASLVSQVDSAIKAEKVDAAEAKLQKLEKEFEKTAAAQANLARLRESLEEARNKEASKKNLVFIPAGKFIYQDGQEIDLPAFYIGKYEVSNAEYAEFLAWTKKEVEKAHEGDPHRFCYPGYLPDGKELSEEQLAALQKMSVEKRLAAIEKMGLEGGEPGGKNHENEGGPANHPAVTVDWYDAWAYCRWRGGRLPTEVEWEKAASWDPKLKRKHVYPYGDACLPQFCNTREPGDGFDGLCPVDAFPKGVSPYGCFNMAGNVWEWCDSWFDKQVDHRIFRGGSWSIDAGSCWAAYRINDAARSRGDVGFRFARRP